MCFAYHHWLEWLIFSGMALTLIGIYIVLASALDREEKARMK